MVDHRRDLRVGRWGSIRFHLLPCAAVVVTLQFGAMAQQTIDCSKTNSLMERTICGDSALSDLNRELTEALQRSVAEAGADSFVIRADERRWLAGVNRECRRVACFRRAFEIRISELKSEKTIPRGTFTMFRLTKLSAAYDFVVRMFGHTLEGLDGYIEGPGEVLVSRKGEIAPLQTIIMENILVSFADGKPFTESGPIYQGFINVGDFDFDGHEDFAIQDGSEGSYAQPTYSVFLYSTERKQFVLNHPLSDLTHDGRGSFGLDAINRHLIVLSKSGCCRHDSTEYKVQHGAPIPVSRVSRDGAIGKDYLSVWHETFIRGRWHEDSTRRVPVVAYSSF